MQNKTNKKQFVFLSKKIFSMSNCLYEGKRNITMMIDFRQTTWTAFKPPVVLISLVFLSRHLHVASYAVFTNSTGLESSLIV